MATASIQSLVNGINPVVGASREDLRTGDTVTLTSVGGPANTWAWSIAFKPEDADRNPSAATLVGNVFGPGPLTFVVDNQGAYLIRLVVDAGLPTMDEQYVRLRFDTIFGDLRLVAAGERRDGTGVIPVDASAEGWANDQNFNINKLLALVEHVSASGRIIYVDANRGKNNLNPPDDPTIAEGYADFSTISEAILAANTNAIYNGTIPPSATQPMVVAVRPGFYQEDVTFQPYVHVIGWPSTGGGVGDRPDFDRSVTVRCANVGGPPAGTMTANLPNLGEYCYIANLVLENVGITTNALVRKIGLGDVYFTNVELLQSGGGAPSQGAAISVERGRAFLLDCRGVQEDTFSGESVAFRVQSSAAQNAYLQATDSQFIGPSIGTVDENQVGGNNASLFRCNLEQVGNDPASFAVRSWAEDLVLEDCVVEVDPGGVVTQAMEINADAAGVPGDLSLTLRRTRLGDDSTGVAGLLGITIDATGVVGTAFLRLASSEFGTVTEVGAITRQAMTVGTSLFYDNAVSGLASDNVQDAIDEVAGGGGIFAGVPFITHAISATLSDNRVLSAGIGTTITNSGVDDGSVTVDLTATGVAAASYTRTDLTVDAQGRITTASDGVVEFTFARQMFVETVAPSVTNEFHVINFANGFSFLGGASGALRVYFDVGGPFAAMTFLDVLVGPPGALVTILPAPLDLATLAAAPSLTSVVLAAGPFTFAAGNIIQMQVTYTAPAPGGTDGLVVSLTGQT